MNEDTALIVVDLQVDFCPGGALPVADGDAVIETVNRLARLFPVVVATQDWHPAGHVSFASSHPGRQPFQTIEIPGLPHGEAQVLWPDHCVQGSAGAHLHPEFDLAPVDLILRKGTRRELDSYSAFFENDRRTPTGLEGYLRTRGIGSVVLAGLARDVCVYYSAMDAVRLGFRTVVLLDATRSVDQPAGSSREREEQMRAHGIDLLDSSRLAQA